MKKKTVAQLSEEIEYLHERMGNVQVIGALVWNTKQIKELIDKEDDDNGAFKIEITHGFEPGRKCYEVRIWRVPRIIKKPRSLKARKLID